VGEGIAVVRGQVTFNFENVTKLCFFAGWIAWRFCNTLHDFWNTVMIQE
jgi:hypothetical protein